MELQATWNLMKLPELQNTQSMLSPTWKPMAGSGYVPCTFLLSNLHRSWGQFQDSYRGRQPVLSLEEREILWRQVCSTVAGILLKSCWGDAGDHKPAGDFQLQETKVERPDTHFGLHTLDQNRGKKCYAWTRQNMIFSVEAGCIVAPNMEV